MDDLPTGASTALPKHTKIYDNGTDPVVPCQGTEVAEVESDVGLYCGKCPVCGKYFVYMFKNNSWMAEDEFDNQAKVFQGDLL